MIKYPNYDRSILSIASSVLNHFGVKDCQHKTLPEFDKLLEKNYKNIITGAEPQNIKLLKVRKNKNE